MLRIFGRRVLASFPCKERACIGVSKNHGSFPLWGKDHVNLEFTEEKQGPSFFSEMSKRL